MTQVDIVMIFIKANRVKKKVEEKLKKDLTKKLRFNSLKSS